MKLIDITCPKCKATMKVSKNRKEIDCEYCGNKILIDDEVVKVVHIKNGEITEEQEYINADTSLNKFNDYDKAYDLYKSLSSRYLDNPEVWLGLLRCSTHDFSNKGYKKEYEEFAKKYFALADEKDADKWKTKYDKYIKGFSEYDKRMDKTDTGKDYLIATIFGGWFGLHHFLKNENGLGLLYLFTGGLFFIGWFYDIFQEVNKHPDKADKANNILAVAVILLGIGAFESDPLSGILLIACGILTFDFVTKKVWKKPVSYSKWIKIGLFILALIVSR